MRRSLDLLPLLLLPIGIFLLLFHPAMLDVGNAGWLIRGTDNGENALGLHANLHDSGAGASLRTGLLNAPDGLPILFTDSNPLLALLAKPVAAFLPQNAQLVGPWLLVCLFLQILLCRALLRPFAPGRLALWTGVVLMGVLPTLINRSVHANLFAHWLILAALWLFVDQRRARRMWAWALLIAATTLVHNYLLLMVAAIWASAMLEWVFTTRGRDRWPPIVGGVAILAMVAALALWVGAGGHYRIAGNYGAFSMPLDALVNPANPLFSTMVHAIPQRELRGFEGFQYLGAGLLLLLPVAIWIAVKQPAAEAERDLHRRLLWLLPAMVVLTLLAISSFPDIAGHRLPRIPLPPATAPFLDLIRASGRLFWPVAYTFVFVVIVAIYRLPRDRAGLVLTAALAIQVIDLGNAIVDQRAASAAAADRRLYVLTPDPRWQAAIAGASDVSLEPGDATKHLALFQEIAWRAAMLGRPVRTVYAARMPIASIERLAREHRAFVAGDLDPRRLYVLAPGTRVPEGARSRARRLDGIDVLIPVTVPSARPATT